MWRLERINFINKRIETLEGLSFHVIGACAKVEAEV